MRTSLERLLRLVARARSRRHSGPHLVGARTLDHGYLVPTALTSRLDHHDHERRLLQLIEQAVREAGGRVSRTRTDGERSPQLAVQASKEAVWHRLGSAGGASSSLPLTVHTRGQLSRRRRWSRRLTRFAAGVEFTEATLPPEAWGAPIPLGSNPPGDDVWLVAGHASNLDRSRHLGIESGVELSFDGNGAAEIIPDVAFPVDVVYTWVDCLDPEWRRRYQEAVRPDDLVRAAATESRFNHLDELRYSLRSLAEFAPWVHHIWLVTAGQVPAWLDVSDPQITVVDHAEIWRGEPGLPTFNSQAIEAGLHRIPGLTEHFLYFNDDMLIGRPIAPETFFEPDGRPKVFVSTASVPLGEANSADLAPDAAGKNNRRLIAQATGRTMSAKYQHAPYALRKSVIEQLEQRFGAELAATRRSTFRAVSDVTVAGGLHHSYALATEQAVVGQIRNRYVNLESPEADHLLDLITRYRYYESFCLNVIEEGPRDPALLTKFLNGYFPNPARWEIDGSQG